MPRAVAIAAAVAAVALVGALGTQATGQYTVRRGDTLAGIASAQHTTVGALASANGISNRNLVLAGQILTIPGGSSAHRSPASASGADKTSLVLYIGKDHPGALLEILTEFAVRGINLTRIESRPTGGGIGDYFFSTSPLVRCPVRGAHFMNDWGFPRSDTGFHQGNDLMAPRGTPIVASVSGTVTQGVGSIGGRFFRLTAKDGTVYYGAHMSKFGKAGRVRAGDVIGYVGNTGDAAGGATHLHFEIHPAGGTAVNPYMYLVRACT